MIIISNKGCITRHRSTSYSQVVSNLQIMDCIPIQSMIYILHNIILIQLIHSIITMNITMLLRSLQEINSRRGPLALYRQILIVLCNQGCDKEKVSLGFPRFSDRRLLHLPIFIVYKRGPNELLRHASFLTIFIQNLFLLLQQVDVLVDLVVHWTITMSRLK